MTNGNVKSIKKEAISNLIFKENDVLLTVIERNIRTRKLYRAMLLGNNYKHKARITFSTSNGINKVNTTIWSTTEKFVILKGGVIIPVTAIWDIVMV